MSIFRLFVLQEKTQKTLSTLRYRTFAIGAYFEKVGDTLKLKIALTKKRRKWFVGIWDYPIDISQKISTAWFGLKKLLNEHYKQYRTVQYYAEELAITPKKLNSITKKHCGETAIQAIHNRILMEIKRQLMFSDLSHKEIAFDLGFNSPSALNKFVKAKLKETPTELQQELAQMYNA